ncbi:hypothetical protein BZL30_2707 [Mycobacterium kansasii]|uniref:Uncharacterized protein n=1 Tax=Mycobacterium kansasii TaxID=1768 RepID=A0A1V3XIF9_MYCKA|nr:hypothetical protein BZL30_2707 [Mycobacterium kansasii]
MLARPQTTDPYLVPSDFVSGIGRDDRMPGHAAGVQSGPLKADANASCIALSSPNSQ